jgi:hypothetical protein
MFQAHFVTKDFLLNGADFMIRFTISTAFSPHFWFSGVAAAAKLEEIDP